MKRSVVGTRIRQFRLKKRLSLTELAAQAHVSKSLVSQLEHGQANPSIETVHALAALEVPVFTLFLEENGAHGQLVRKDERIKLTVPGSPAVRELLSPSLRQSMMVVLSRIPPQSAASPAPRTHRGEECVYVLSGTLNVQLGDQLHTLITGDTLYFDARVPHLFSNAEDTEVEIITAATQPIS